MGEFLCFKFKMVFGIISIHVGMVEVLGQDWYSSLFVHVKCFSDYKFRPQSVLKEKKLDKLTLI